jgi:flagellar protein FlaJ
MHNIQWLKRKLADQRGITGLETAIILIAFVVVASVFAYTVLSAGVFSSEKGKEAIHAGIEQARGTMEIVGGIVLKDTGVPTGSVAQDDTVDQVIFTVANALDGEALDLTTTVDSDNDGTLSDETGRTHTAIISYIDKNQRVDDIAWTRTQVGKGDSDALLEAGEPEADFLAAEAAIQGEAFGNIYERSLETLKKWTDAFTALIVSASLIIVVATVSTMIFDLGITFVGGLVVTMVMVCFLGVWIIFRAVPSEIRTIPGSGGDRTQAPVKKMLMMTMPAGLAAAAVVTLVNVDFGLTMIGLGVLMLPVGIMAKRLDGRVNDFDKDIATFLRVLGVTVSSIGTTPVVALGRIDMRSMPSLVEPVRRLRTRLIARVDPVQSWQRFIDETGSELVARSVRVYLDGTNLGGDADEVGKRASLWGSKMNQLREMRKLVSDSFTYLSMAMHVVVGFLLIFIVEVVSGFNDLVSSAGVNVPGGPGAALGSVLAFNLDNLAFLRNSMVPVLLSLAAANALAPKISDGGYSLTLFFYLGMTSILSGVAMVVAPVLAHVIFGAAATV